MPSILSLFIFGLFSLIHGSVLDQPQDISQSGPPYFLLDKTPLFQRVVYARSYRDAVWTIQNKGEPSMSPNQLGSLLASLKPTYVHGLIRLNNGANASEQAMNDYNLIRNTVLQSAPYCKFDIHLDAMQYAFGDGDTLRAKIDSLINSFPSTNGRNASFDIVFFDRLNQAFAKNPMPFLINIPYLHRKGFIVGGASYGGKVPLGTDFQAVDTTNFVIDAFDNSQNIPTLGYISNANPNIVSSEQCAFVGYGKYDQPPNVEYRSLDTESRWQVIQSLANNQKTQGYSLAWPFFNPECPGNQAYDSTEEYVIVGTFGNQTVFKHLARSIQTINPINIPMTFLMPNFTWEKNPFFKAPPVSVPVPVYEVSTGIHHDASIWTILLSLAMTLINSL